MPFLDNAQARELLLRVVTEAYAERNSPVPGAYIKTQLLARAAEEGHVFSERALGFKSFVDFVRSAPDIGVQDRPGSDVLLAPVTASDILSAYATPLPRLRRDFWRAFVEFPVPGTVRLYDPGEDKILHENAATQRQGILITPIPRETQLEWRVRFAEEQSENIRSLLLAALEGTGTAVFNEFARRLRENPAVMRTWNRYLQKLITDHVEAWAASHGISEDRWCAGRQVAVGGELEAPPSRVQNISQRAELYNFFDNLPLEDLLQLRVPLEWVLKVNREKR